LLLNKKYILLFLFIISTLVFFNQTIMAGDYSSGITLSNEDVGVKVLETTSASGYSFYVNSKVRSNVETHTYFSFGLRYYLDRNIYQSPFISTEFFSYDRLWLYKIGGGYRTRNLLFELGYKNYGPGNIYFGMSFDFNWRDRQSKVDGSIRFRSKYDN